MKKNEESKVITKDMTIEQAMQIKKEARYILMGFGMHCFGCPVHQMETLEEAAVVHGIDVDYLMEKLNETI